MLNKSKLNNDLKIAMLFLLPSFIGFVVFILFPILSSFLLSFTNYSGSFAKTKFTGFNNYKLIFSDSKFWKSISVTMVFVFFSIIFQLFLGFVFAEMIAVPLLG